MQKALVSVFCAAALLLGSGVRAEAPLGQSTARSPMPASRAPVRMTVQPAGDKTGRPEYVFNRPVRVAVQGEFLAYMGGKPWNETRQQILNALGENNVEFLHEHVGELAGEVENAGADFVIVDPGLYIRFQMTGQIFGMASLWPLGAADPAYAEGVLFVVRNDDGTIHDIQDVAEKQIGGTFPRSFIWLIGLREFQKKHMDHEAIASTARYFGNDITKILGALKKGEIDVAVIPSCSFEQLSGEGTINAADFKPLDVIDRGTTRCMYSSDLYPSFYVGALSGTDQVIRKAMNAALFPLTAVTSGLDWGPVASPRMVHELYYDLKVGPYQHLAAFRFQRFMREQSGWVIAVLGGIILIFIYAGSVSILVRRRTAALNKALEERNEIERQVEVSRDHISQLERTGIVGQMSTMIAHELKQPLGAITNFANGMLRRLKRGQFDAKAMEDVLAEIVEQGSRASEIVDRVRSYAKQTQPMLTLSDMSLAVQSAISSFARSRRTDAEIKTQLQPYLWADIDFWEIELAVLNFLKNAADAVEGQSDACITVRVRPEDRFWRIEVSDNGPKVTQADVERFMMPLVTSKAGGLGLGLSICSNIAERHHGHISGYANPERGVTITMDIPRAAIPEHTAM